MSSPAMTAWRRALQAVFTLLVLWAVALLGQIPYGHESDRAALRLALRTVQGRIEICRERTAAELERLPRHMQTPTVCTEHTPVYRLQVRADGRLLLDQDVSPGGLRGDRPLIVDRQVEVAPALIALDVEFSPIEPPDASAEERAACSELPRYAFSSPVAFERGRVVLLTIDDEAGRLVLGGS